MREITRLDYFAGLAMQEMIRLEYSSSISIDSSLDYAIDIAEKLIAKLDAKQKTIAPTFLPKIIETSTGYKWQVNEKTAKDLASGFVWQLKDEDGEYTYDAAIEKFGDKIAKKEEWEAAEEHGCREILGLQDAWYWSASVNALNRATAWLFYGACGNVTYSYRNFNYSVRCIAR